MFTRLRQFFRYAFGERTVSIQSETPSTLVLRFGSVRTSFDRTSGHIAQNGKLVATLPLVERIEIHMPRGQEGTMNWYITVHVTGARQVEVGQVTDQIDASLIGARIATITGKEVAARL